MRHTDFTPFTRRRLMMLMPVGLAVAACQGQGRSNDQAYADEPETTGALPQTPNGDIDWAGLSEAQWRERLSPAAFNVLRKEDTERPFTSALNEETRPGIYHCAGCDLPLFSSETKYKSGTGWPSFWDHLDGAFETKPDRMLFYVRTEYHCARCGGHQGHVFDDGPEPTGKRWCNNGVALTFRPA